MRMAENALPRRCMTLAAAAAAAVLFSFPAMGATVQQDFSIPMTDAKELKAEWKADQVFSLADPAPWTLEELKQAVDVQDPRSVAAYFVWAVNRMTDDYDDGMAMMKYLFADIEPFGRGFYEGGLSQKAGWMPFLNERLSDPYYRWLPRAFFEGVAAGNGFAPQRPLKLELYYNSTNTEMINAQTLKDLGRLNIVYWVKSHAGGIQVNITLSRFEDSDRWYVTSGVSSSALFYDQNGAVEAETRPLIDAAPNDGSTEAEHLARYGGQQ